MKIYTTVKPRKLGFSTDYMGRWITSKDVLLAKEVIKKIENREGEYRFAFTISHEEQEKRYTRVWAAYKNRFSQKELEDIQYDAMMNVYHSLHSPYIGEFDIMETDDKEVWDIYEAGFEGLISQKDEEAEHKKRFN